VGADPPVRLHQVVSAVQSRFGAACLPGALKSPAAPYCVVNDVTIGGPTPTLAEIPSCSASGNATPCWRLQTNSACPALVDSLGQIEQLTMVVDRVGSPPPNTAPVAACELQ
jgi:hypothetical protein